MLRILRIVCCQKTTSAMCLMNLVDERRWTLLLGLFPRSLMRGMMIKSTLGESLHELWPGCFIILLSEAWLQMRQRGEWSCFRVLRIGGEVLKIGKGRNCGANFRERACVLRDITKTACMTADMAEADPLVCLAWEPVRDLRCSNSVPGRRAYHRICRMVADKEAELPHRLESKKP